VFEIGGYREGQPSKGIQSFSFLKAGMQIRIRSIEESWIRIRIKVKIQELWRLKREPWRAADAGKGGVKAQNVALEGIYCRPAVEDELHFDKEQDPDPAPH
jgi:hypothetical protein